MSGDRRALVYEKMRPGTAIIDYLTMHGIRGDLPFGPGSCLRRAAPLSSHDFVELAQGYDAVIGASAAQLTSEVLRELPDLKVVSKLGIGYDVIDLDACTELGIAVTNTPSEVEIDSVAEHAAALLLACAKRLDFYTTDRMKAGGWHDPDVPGLTLHGKTLGVIGFGRIGSRLAARFQNWGMRILAYDLRGPDVSLPPYVEPASLDELLAMSDFVSLHLSSDINGGPVLGPKEIARTKRGAVLVNTSRGRNVDQVALAEALSTRQILAAGIDVFSTEPPAADDPILTVSNVLLTPHLGAVTVESEIDMDRMAADNVVRILAGQRPDALLNPDVLGRSRIASSLGNP
jgi:phosphoglycerate dehydrogenase-like enzyme